MYESLLQMPLKLQMQNIVAEVERGIRFTNSNKLDRANARIEEAIKMIDKVKSKPENKYRIKEFDFMEEELLDYINGSEKYDTDAESLLKQYSIFNNY